MKKLRGLLNARLNSILKWPWHIGGWRKLWGQTTTILPILTEKGIRVRAHDPEGMHEAKKQLPNLDYCDDAYDAMKDADVLVILTEWNSYRSLDLDRVKSLLKAPVFIDLRNIYRPDEMAAAGFRYQSLGRTA